MSEIQLIVLAIVQGITEFLPISSSGHLILVPVFTGWPDQGLEMDIAVHVGTLGAVILYLWRDLWQMLRSIILFRSQDDELVKARRMIVMLIAGTIPIVVVGLLFKDFFSESLRSMAVIGWAMLGFGIVLYVIDRVCPDDRPLEDMKIRGAVIIGLWQILALIPGTSRAGITMTGARLMGFSRTEAARFSMLLSIPTILAAGLLLAKDMIDAGQCRVGAGCADRSCACLDQCTDCHGINDEMVAQCQLHAVCHLSRGTGRILDLDELGWLG